MILISSFCPSIGVPVGAPKLLIVVASAVMLNWSLVSLFGVGVALLTVVVIRGAMRPYWDIPAIGVVATPPL